MVGAVASYLSLENQKAEEARARALVLVDDVADLCRRLVGRHSDHAGADLAEARAHDDVDDAFAALPGSPELLKYLGNRTLRG